MAIYRFILMSRADRADTGASYPGCSPNSTAQCDPRGFDGPNAMQQAIDYATSHNEIPVQVSSQKEAFDMIAGVLPVPREQVLSSSMFGNLDMTTVLLVALGAIFVVPMLFKKRG